MLKKIFRKLEDPKYPLLGPNIKSLKFWGILLPKAAFKRSIYMFLHASIFVFAITEFVDIWFVRSDLNHVLTNMKISMLATVSCTKIGTFLIRQNNWKDIIEYVTRADISSGSKADKNDNKIVRAYTRYCRNITFFYCFLTYATAIIVIVQPMFKYLSSSTYRDNVRNGIDTFSEVVNSWVPFDKNTMPGYLVASAYQSFATIYAGGWITSFDTNAIAIMVFFRGELELLKRSCARIFDDDNDDEVMRRMKECYKRHKELVKYAAIYNSCLSPIMFLYMVVCSIMLCASVFQITLETSPMQKFLTAEYLVFGVSQLFIYCWHGNEVLFMSHSLSRGLYESVWYKPSTFNRRRELMLLTGQFNKRVYFTAGPFANLTIAAFISIIRGTYSYYTLIKK